MSANQDNTVILDIGGIHYKTSLTTINNYPNSMLAKIVSDRWNPNSEGSNKPIFIDRNGQRFKYVLDYLRDGKVNLPVGENVETFRTELEYFGIDIHPDSITSDDDLEMVSLKSRFRNHMKILDDKIEACEMSYVTHMIAKDVVRKAVELQSQNYLESSSESDISSEIVYKWTGCKHDLVYNFLHNLKKRKSAAAEKECRSSIKSHIANFKLGIAVKYIKKRKICNGNSIGTSEYIIGLSSSADDDDDDMDDSMMEDAQMSQTRSRNSNSVPRVSALDGHQNIPEKLLRDNQLIWNRIPCSKKRARARN